MKNSVIIDNDEFFQKFPEQHKFAVSTFFADPFSNDIEEFDGEQYPSNFYPQVKKWEVEINDSGNVTSVYRPIFSE